MWMCLPKGKEAINTTTTNKQVAKLSSKRHFIKFLMLQYIFRIHPLLFKSQKLFNMFHLFMLNLINLNTINSVLHTQLLTHIQAELRNRSSRIRNQIEIYNYSILMICVLYRDIDIVY